MNSIKILITMGVLSSIFGMVACNRNKFSDEGSKPSSNSFFAKQITISQLEEELGLLQKGRTEFDFIGITSNGVDCIYFVKNNDKFNIEFEAMAEAQIPFIEKLKEYANSKCFQYSMTTYGNKPKYESVKNAPVIHIETKTNLSETAKLGREIEQALFGNNDETKYDVVP